MYDVVVVGAGASGLVSAILLAKRGKRVIILEKSSRVGKKLLATGNGRCNISNIKPTPNRFHSQNPKFISETLDGYGYKTVKKFFKSIGLELIEAKEGKVFPMSLQALSVVNILEYELNSLGVDIILNARVKEIRKSRYFKVAYNSSMVESKNVVIATGNLSAPELGGVDDGLKFAKEFGHTLIKTSPSLVQLTSNMPNLKRVAGVKIYSRVSIEFKDGVVTKEGDTLFTKYGVSGLAILDISRMVIERLKDSKRVTLTIDLMPKIGEQELISIMKKSLRKNSKKPIDIWLQGFINRKLISILELDNLIEQSITSKDISKIVKSIKFFKITIDGSRGYRGAEVATGGVNTKEIDPKRLESKKEKGLYFTGEVLDVDGDRGGFNLHFAWVSALRVGSSI